MKSTISNEQWQFPPNDPRVVIGAQVARIARGQVVAVGTISKLTPTQLQAEGMHAGYVVLYYRATGYPIDKALTGYIRLATDEDLAAFEQYKAEQEQRQAEIAERTAAAARNTETNLRRFAALIQAATSATEAMARLSQFASYADVHGLGSEWPESEKQ